MDLKKNLRETLSSQEQRNSHNTEHNTTKEDVVVLKFSNFNVSFWAVKVLEVVETGHLQVQQQLEEALVMECGQEAHLCKL